MRDHPLRPYVEALVRACTLLLALMPLVPPRLMVGIIACWLTSLVLRSFTDPVPLSRSHFLWCLFLALPFAVMLLDIIRSSDPMGTWKVVERSSSFVIFPLGFLVLGAPSSKRFVGMFTTVFTGACVLLLLYANSSVLMGDHGARTFVDGNAYRSTFASATGIHPPFAAYFFLTAALLQLDRTLEEPWKWPRVVAILLLIISAALLGSRMPLAAFGIASGAMAFVRLGWKRALLVWGGLLLLLIAFAALLPSSRQRVDEALRHGALDLPPDADPLHAREVVGRCAWQVTKEHWLLGVGQGEAQRTLDACYAGLGETHLLDGSYSTHDQLLHWWLCFGLAGAVIYVLYFGTLIRSAAHERNAAQLGLLVFLLICACTENVLSRQWGLVLFMCFTTMFVAMNIDREATGN